MLIIFKYSTVDFKMVIIAIIKIIYMHYVLYTKQYEIGIFLV